MSGKKEFYLTFGQLVQSARKKLGLTQDDLADFIGLGKLSIYCVEKGKMAINFRQGLMLCHFLNIRDLLYNNITPESRDSFIKEQKTKRKREKIARLKEQLYELQNLDENND